MGVEDRSGGRGGRGGPRGDLRLEAPGEVGGGGVGGQGVEQGVGDLRPHPLPVLACPQAGEALGDGGSELGDGVPDLGDPGAGEGRTGQDAGRPPGERGRTRWSAAA